MARRFSVMDMMNEISREDAAKTGGIEMVSVHDIRPSPDNFYEPSCIDQLKNSIYAMGGVRQNVLLVRNGDDGSPYRVVAGHRRIQACLELVREGHGEFEHVPAVVLEDADRDTEHMLLVMTNSTQRELSDWEKVMQHMHLKEIIPKLKKRQGLDGRTRELEADYLGVSEAQVAIYNTIGTRLDAWLMAVFKDGGIGISLAYEAAKLEPAEQQELVRITAENGSFTGEDIRRLAGSRVIKGQQRIQKYVSDSDTSAETKEEPVHIPAAEKKEICHTASEDDVDEAIFFIFRLYDFPEDKLQKLIEAYRKDRNHIAAETAFYGMLPLENSDIKVIYQMGYQIEYIHTGEIVKIPVYYFWKGFEREFEREIKRETDQTGVVEDMKNVSESDTFDTEKPDECELQETGFRGGYTLAMVDHQIRKYEGYLDMAGEAGGLDNLVCEYNCLLDALGLLRERLAMVGECDTYENDND